MFLRSTRLPALLLLTAVAALPARAYTTTRLLQMETAYTDDFVQIGLWGQSGVGGIADRVQITTFLPLDLVASINADFKVLTIREVDGMPVTVALGGGWLHQLGMDRLKEELEKDEPGAIVDIDATIFKAFAVVSREVNPKLRVHGTMQMMRGGLKARVEGTEESEDFQGGLVTMALEPDNNSLMLGADLHLADSLILMGEAGSDLTNGVGRYGLGLATGIGPFRLGLGATWPGIGLTNEDALIFGDDDEASNEEIANLPCIPRLTLAFRF